MEMEKICAVLLKYASLVKSTKKSSNDLPAMIDQMITGLFI
jgi:hypothetical protein